MPAPYSYDLRSKAIEAVKRGEKKIEVSRFFKISRNTLDLWLKKERETGDYQASQPVGVGTVPKITDLEKFRKFVEEHSDKTQKQMAEIWGNNVTQQTVSYAIKKLGFTRKKTYGYRERDEQKREEFIKKLEEIENTRKVYVDETGFDNREDYPYGYSLKGQRCYALKSGKRTERVSWLSALKENQLLAPLTFEGSCNRNLFENWLIHCLIPNLDSGDIIIIDNASFQKGEYIREIVEEAGCEIWDLPAYSPDLNKIENWWAVLKTWMKQRIIEFDTVRECVDAAFKKCPNVCA
ncbi:IS630 family transposase [Moorena sp. SIO4A5]|uniref:IS630 family transposase n=1 Tax=Moorena sp. SIO4A5 TaxID=2607838 RepID=UPI0025D99B96|nr:IS630 family transposase [Moorena sp. SIO4A5]